MPNICSCNHTANYYTGLVTTKRKKERCLFSLFKFLEGKLFFLSSSSSFSSARHIIYHYEINDKFFEHFKTRLLFQMNNYSAQHFYVSYFYFCSITYCNFCSNYNNLTNIIVISLALNCNLKFCFSIYLLYSVIFIWNLYHSQDGIIFIDALSTNYTQLWFHSVFLFLHNYLR